MPLYAAAFVATLIIFAAEAISLMRYATYYAVDIFRHYAIYHFRLTRCLRC